MEEASLKKLPSLRCRPGEILRKEKMTGKVERSAAAWVGKGEQLGHTNFSSENTGIRIVHTWDYACVGATLLWSCPTLCGPVDCSPTGSSVHGLLQA